MKASIIAIGDELLIGQVQDTNSSWLANELTSLGIKIQSISLIADHDRAIVQTLKDQLEQSDFIIFTGGLGPTKDDVTKETLASFFGVDFKLDQSTLDRITKWFESRNRMMIQENKDQALIPANAEVLPNYVGTAPGMWFEENDAIVVSVPGVPYEMMELFEKQIKPRLEKMVKSESAIEHRTLVVSGIPESILSKELTDYEENLPNDMQLSYLPNFQIIRLRLTDYKPDGSGRVDYAYERLQKEVKEHLIALGDFRIEEIIGNMLLEQGATVSFAESCTGGNIAHRMTSVPGSSRYFEGGIVAYSYDIKETNLGISHELLLEFGAVSKEIVEAMAVSVRERMNTTYSIAVSGIAGPGGGMPNKPVGTVWIAASSENEVKSKMFHFRGDRQKVIRHTTSMALEFLRRLVNSQEAVS